MVIINSVWTCADNEYHGESRYIGGGVDRPVPNGSNGRYEQIDRLVECDGSPRLQALIGTWTRENVDSVDRSTSDEDVGDASDAELEDHSVVLGLLCLPAFSEKTSVSGSFGEDVLGGGMMTLLLNID